MGGVAGSRSRNQTTDISCLMNLSLNGESCSFCTRLACKKAGSLLFHQTFSRPEHFSAVGEKFTKLFGFLVSFRVDSGLIINRRLS